MSDKYVDYVKARVMPAPQRMEVLNGTFRISDGCKITLRSSVDESAIVARRFLESWNVRPEITFIPEDVSIARDGYNLEVTETECFISASNESGVLNAISVLRQLEEAERGVMTSSCWHVPCVRIHDYPALAFRGIHICWFPETPSWEIEKLIRLAAHFRYNVVVLESWGVIQLDSHPEFCWKEHAVPKTEIQRLVKLAASLGITLCPQVNIFGHGTASRVIAAKHVLLDTHPEYASLYEADGWTWCISNPFTRKYLTDMVVEMHGLFDNPPYFHIGCDEAYNAGNCSLCHEGYPQRFKEYLLYFHDLLAARGSRSMMWHDMLLHENDERWKGYITSGNPDIVPDTFLQELPKDMLICDWQYYYPKETDGPEPSWPTMKAFQQAGFDVLACPWLNRDGIASIGRCAAENKFFGLLETTWNFMQGTPNFHTAFALAGTAAWNAFAEPVCNVNLTQYTAHAVRRICRDMGLKNYTQFGTAQFQIPPFPTPCC